MTTRDGGSTTRDGGSITSDGGVASDAVVSTLDDGSTTLDGGTAVEECEPDRCEDDVLVRCSIESGAPVITRTPCALACEEAACTEPPRDITITASSSGPLTPVHTVTEHGELISLTTLAAAPSFSPEPPDGALPDLASGAMTVVSPSTGGCAIEITPTLDASSLSLFLSGITTLPDTTCQTFVDAAASEGLELRITGAPYTGGAGELGSTDVTVRFLRSP